LRSPKANDGARGALGEATALERGNSVQIGDQVLDLAAQNGLQTSRRDLMPTPNTMDSLPPRDGDARERQLRRGGSNSRRASSGNLREDILEVLPTPTTRDHKDGTEPHERDGIVQTDTVARAVFNSGEVSEISWGKFEPAIRRWEAVLGRPAPAPTKPDGKDGAHRLSSEFTEWMMGLPHGWVTGAGLSRNDELKMCGNGVVPQQAELALRVLLEGVELQPATAEKLLATPNTMDSLPPRYGEAYEKVKNSGGRKNRQSSGNLREQVVHVIPEAGGV
jgi:hypothetical protein